MGLLLGMCIGFYFCSGNQGTHVHDITWPPSADGHVINEQLCRKLRLSPTVISLMKKIPYPKDIDYACRMELFPYSNPYAGETRSGCDPLWLRP